MNGETYFERLQKIKQGLLPKEAVPKPKKGLNKKSLKKIEEEKQSKEVGNDVSLDKWFEEIQHRHWGSNFNFPFPCMECGKFIPVKYARHATAHLLPKKTFKSVATHPLNYLILGANCGCHYHTDRVDKFVKMKCWPQAKERILQMMPLLPTDELRRISNQLLIALDMTEK